MHAPLKRAYAPPTIGSELGKVDAVPVRNDQNRIVKYCDQIDGIAVEQLAQQFGSPLFVYSERTIIDTVRRAKKAFTSRYPNTRFFTSVKTCYLNAICNILTREGSGSEVVSEFELSKVERNGVAGADLIINGPVWSRETLRHAMESGVLVQIDNHALLQMVEQIAAAMDRPVDVGIRIAIDTGLAPFCSKFGFDLDNGEASHAIVRVLQNPHLRLHTLHSQLGTQIFDPQAYTVATEKLVALLELIYEQKGVLVAAINMGGGFPSSAKLHSQPEDFKVPPIEEYAQAITGVLNRLPKKLRPQLRLESGRHLVDDAGHLISTVCAVKGSRAPNAGKRARGAYVLDAATHMLFPATWNRIAAMPTAPSPPALNNTVKLYDSSCMSIGVIREAVDLPPLDVGDRLVMHPVGAYCVVQSQSFITLKPACVLVGVDGRVRVIRRREQLADVEMCEGDN